MLVLMFYTVLTEAKMFLISFLLLGCLNFATSTKPQIFTITSPTTLQRQLESISYDLLNPVDEAFLKNTLLLTLQTVNETALSENRSPILEASARVELRDTYISFGNISGMLTNVTYVDFFQLAQSTVDIIMKVEEGLVQRKIQINSTINTQKMTLTGNVTLLGSAYTFTIELSNPTFHWDIYISEGLSTKTIQLENFTFNVMTTSLQPKDFTSFLIGRGGLAENVLQRMADSWLPPIAESLQNSHFYKIQNYEKKLRSDTTSFEYKMCRWAKNQRILSVRSILDESPERPTIDITINTGSYKSCRADFFDVKKTNSILISQRVTYESGAYVSAEVTELSSMSTDDENPAIRKRRLVWDGFMFNQEQVSSAPIPTISPAPIIPTPSKLTRSCAPIEIYAIEAKIELQLEKGTTRISRISDTYINLHMENTLQHQDCWKLKTSNPKSWLTSLLQKELTRYLNVLLLSTV